MTWPDVEGAVKDYLVSEVASARGAYYAVPVGALGTPSMFPMLIVQRVGGGQDPSEAPVDLALMQITVIGRERDKEGCWNTTSETRDALAAIRGNTPIRSDVMAYGAEVESVVYSPDTDGRPRYVVTAMVTASAT
jgi:hypothetical protein